MHILAQGPLPTTSLLALLAFGILLLLILILRFKLQAFLALLVASIAVMAGAIFVNGKSEKVDITGGSGDGTAITIESIAHGREAGAIIEITECEPVAFNGKWKIKGGVSADSFVAVPPHAARAAA